MCLPVYRRESNPHKLAVDLVCSVVSDNEEVVDVFVFWLAYRALLESLIGISLANAQVGFDIDPGLGQDHFLEQSIVVLSTLFNSIERAELVIIGNLLPSRASNGIMMLVSRERLQHGLSNRHDLSHFVVSHILLEDPLGEKLALRIEDGGGVFRKLFGRWPR